ncbi:hypothetical protein C8J56DRAFT_1020152 [Mycena floridula]|nr:hypothetical protein C8J56DRAFT_1020152 [Mycena floridula]
MTPVSLSTLPSKTRSKSGRKLNGQEGLFCHVETSPHQKQFLKQRNVGSRPQGGGAWASLVDLAMRLSSPVTGAQLVTLIEHFLDEVSLETQKTSPRGALHSVFNAYSDDPVPDQHSTDDSDYVDDTDALRSIFDAYFDDFRSPLVASPVVTEALEKVDINAALRAIFDAYFFRRSMSCDVVESTPTSGSEARHIPACSGGRGAATGHSPSQFFDWSRADSCHSGLGLLVPLLRAILRQNSLYFDLIKATPSASWACALTELLQNEIKYSADTAYKAMCMRHLQRLTKRFGILPPSFFVHDVFREGTHAVAGGGFADVYEGILDGSPVCLKVLRFFTRSSGMREKLLKNCCREALVWKQLDHPNVLPFLGVSVELFAPSFCLVSPWMSNGNLMEYLEAHPEFNRLNAISEIAAAMQYLHEYSPSIVHADIRGNNVLIRDDLRCCLADFGLSSVPESFSHSTTSTSSKGSIRWMAPEYLTSSANVNRLKRTTRDIYAFGCTIYEVYMGVPPFSHYRLDYPVIQDVVAGRRPQRTSGLFSDDIWAMVEACWSHQPSDRPSAAMVARALQHPSSQTTLWDRPTVAEGSKFQVQNGAPDSETSSVSSGRSLIEAVEYKRPADDIAPSVTPLVPGNEKGKISLAVQSGDMFQTSRNFTPPALPDRGIQTERSKEKQPIHAVANTPPEAIQTERFKEKQPIHATDLNAWTPISPMVPGNEKEKLSIVIPSQDTPNPSRNFTAPDPIGLGTQTERFKEKQRQDWRLPSPAESIVADPYGTLIAPTRREESIARVQGYLRDQQSPGRSHGTQAWQVLQDLEVPEPSHVQSQSNSPISSRRFGFNLKFNWRRPRNELEPDAELIRMITYLISTSCEDWNMVLKLCERCCVSDLNAKTAVETLAIELKQADLSSQLSTAKLWALMLHNSSEAFSSQCMSRKFVDTLKDMLLNQRTPRELRELLMKVLSDAAYTASVGNRRENAFQTLWRKVKAAGEPEEGIPLMLSDAAYTAGVGNRRENAFQTLWRKVKAPGEPKEGIPLRPEGYSDVNQDTLMRLLCPFYVLWHIPTGLILFSNSGMTSPVPPTVEAILELEHKPPRADEKTTVEQPRVTSPSSEWSVKGVEGDSSQYQYPLGSP